MSRIFLAAAALLSAACQRAPDPPPGRPEHPLLSNLQAPPTNAPLTPTPAAEQAAAAQLPAGTAAALMATRGGQPVTGTFDVRGRLVMQPGSIRVESAGDSALELRYRLPPGVPALRADTGAAQLLLTERSGPAGADRQLVLRAGRATLLGEVWQVAPEPVQFDLRNGLRLVQRGVRVGADSTRYTEAPLEVVEGSRVLARVPIGRATSVQAESGRWSVYVEVSHLFTATASDAGQVRGGYVLRAWVVPER